MTRKRSNHVVATHRTTADHVATTVWLLETTPMSSAPATVRIVINGRA